MLRPLLVLISALWGLTGQGGTQDAADPEAFEETIQEVRELQAALAFLGYSVDAADGIYDSQTTRAVEVFEFSVGMGDEGVLDEGELAVLAARVMAHSYEKFGYRLHGRWQVGDCASSQASLWFEDLVWLADPQTRFALLETELSDPLVLTVEDQTLSLSTPYLVAVNADKDIRFFPLENRLLALVDQEPFLLQHCEYDVDYNAEYDRKGGLRTPAASLPGNRLFTAAPAKAQAQRE